MVRQVVSSVSTLMELPEAMAAVIFDCSTVLRAFLSSISLVFSSSADMASACTRCRPCQRDRVRDAVPRFLRLPDQLGDDAHCGHCHLPAGLPDRRCGKDRGRGHAGRSALPPQAGVQLYAPVSLPHLRGYHPGQLGRQRTGLDRDVTLFSARKKPPACILTGRGLFDHSFSNTRKRNAMSVVSSDRAARRAAPSRGVFQ